MKDEKMDRFFDFLKKGQLGSLQLNMSLVDVFSTIGLPENSFSEKIKSFKDLRKQLPNIKRQGDNSRFMLVWNDLTLDFSANEKLIYINIEGYDPHQVTLPAPLDSSWLSGAFSMDRDTFRQYLQAHSITPYEQKMSAELAHLMLQVWIPESGVRVTFTLEDGQDRIYTLEMLKSLPRDDIAIW